MIADASPLFTLQGVYLPGGGSSEAEAAEETVIRAIVEWLATRRPSDT
jgi:hypothetical protein